MKNLREQRNLVATGLRFVQTRFNTLAGGPVVTLMLGLTLMSSCHSTPALSADLWTITFYDACVRCCGKTDGITASGHKARPNHTIACNWLPFGTKVNIDGSIYTVEDRGAKSLFGSKKNHIKHIDIYVESHGEAKRRGVEYLPVEILAQPARTK